LNILSKEAQTNLWRRKGLMGRVTATNFRKITTAITTARHKHDARKGNSVSLCERVNNGQSLKVREEDMIEEGS